MDSNPILRADYDIYYDQLLIKGRGSPLWIPGPNMALPIEYRREGVRIGDLGIIYRSGGFHFLFNVFFSADHKINKGRVPASFCPLHNSNVQNGITENAIYNPDNYLASSSLHRKYVINSSYVPLPCYIGISNDPFIRSGFVFETSDREGAILIMPDGAMSQELHTLGIVKKYVMDNADSWYQYVNHDCGGEVEKGDIRLVIGVDKVSSWGIATYASSGAEQVRLEFKGVDNGTTSRAYTWDCFGTASAGRVGPQDAEIRDLMQESDGSCLRNQCVFIRTMNFTASGEMWTKSAGHLVRTDDLRGGLHEPAPLNSLSHPANSTATGNVSQFNQPASHINVNSCMQLRQPVSYPLEGSVIIFRRFSGYSSIILLT